MPVFNSEPFLEKTLGCVCAQTLRDVEFICINDGSTDSSLAILEKYALADSRIIVISQENMGPARARNAGLRQAKGQYVGFLDSDDLVSEDYFERMLLAAKGHDADIVLNTHVLSVCAGVEQDYKGPNYLKKLPEGEYLDSLFAIDNTFCLLYAHLYRREILERYDIRFMEESFRSKDDLLCEDEHFHVLSHYHANKVFAFYGPEYRYVQHSHSLTHSRPRVVEGCVRYLSALKDHFGDEILSPDFKLKLFTKQMFRNVTSDEDFKVLKDYIKSLDGYFQHSGVFVSDFIHYAISRVLISESAQDFCEKIGKQPWFKYQTRMRMEKRIPTISVIIPVYNTGDCLDRCLQSACSQSFRDIEVICVNDCSSDNSLEILRLYSSEDRRIKIINLPENGGVSNARNVGLDAAAGKYIAFLDSDDWLDTDYLEAMLQKIEESGKQMVVNANYVNEYADKKTYSGFDWVSKEGSVLLGAMVQRLFPPVIWASLYRRDFIEQHHFRFIKVKHGAEDVHFSGICNLTASELFVFKGPFYHYFQRQGSLSGAKGRGFEYLRSFSAVYDYLLENGVSAEGTKLFYIESLFIETEEQFNFVKDFMLCIKPEVEKNPSIYNEQEKFLLKLALDTPDYETFKQKFNPNISMSFLRSRMIRRTK